MNRRMRLQNYQRTFLRVNPPPSFTLPLVPLVSFASSLLPSFSLSLSLSFFLSFCFSFRPDTRRVDESFVMNENATYLRCATRYVIRHVKGPEGTIENIVVITIRNNVLFVFFLLSFFFFSFFFNPCACPSSAEWGKNEPVSLTWVRGSSPRCRDTLICFFLEDSGFFVSSDE